MMESALQAFISSLAIFSSTSSYANVSKKDNNNERKETPKPPFDPTHLALLWLFI